VIADPGTALLTLHCAVLAAAITGHYKYSDRSEHFEKSLKGLGETLAALKRTISSGLAERLRPVFENAQSVTSVLLDASGSQFQESFVNPVGSEAYREALFSFTASDAEPLLALRSLLDSRDRWLFWARVQCWTVLAAIILEGVIAAALFVSEKLLDLRTGFSWGAATLLPTAACFLVFVTAAIRLSLLHDTFVELRKRYASP